MLLDLKLKRIRLSEQKKLNDKNFSLYKKITSYIQRSILTENEKEEVLQQIMDMMLQAEEEGKSIDLFIGTDYEVFCDNIIKEFSSDKNVIYKILNYLEKYLITFLLIGMCISLVSYLKTGIMSINLEQVILASIISLNTILFVKYIDKKSLYVPLHEKFNFKVNINNSSIAIPIASMLGLIFLIKTIIGNTLGLETLSYNLIIFNNVGIIFLAVLIIILIEIYKRFYNKIV